VLLLLKLLPFGTAELTRWNLALLIDFKSFI